jgi:hypothetical protein
MIQKLNKILVFLTVIAVVLTSAITTKPVHADDGITGGTPEPVVVEETPPAEAVAEIIEQLPEGTEIVVVSEDGVEPLARLHRSLLKVTRSGVRQVRQRLLRAQMVVPPAKLLLLTC